MSCEEGDDKNVNELVDVFASNTVLTAIFNFMYSQLKNAMCCETIQTNITL
jgi:hypothetical protein